MRSWLLDAFRPVRPDIAHAFLFGSVLQRTRTPRDVDLILVAVAGAGAPAWLRLRRRRSVVEPVFERRFGLPLSAKVLTPSEWRELDGTFVRHRERLL